MQRIWKTFEILFIHLSLDFLSKQYVGYFWPNVSQTWTVSIQNVKIVKIDDIICLGSEWEAIMSQCTNINNSRFMSVLYQGPKFVSQVEVAKVIHPHMHFKALPCEGSFRNQKHSSIVDEDVNSVHFLLYLLAKLLNRFEVCEIQRIEGDICLCVPMLKFF